MEADIKATHSKAPWMAKRSASLPSLRRKRSALKGANDSLFLSFPIFFFPLLFLATAAINQRLSSWQFSVWLGLQLFVLMCAQY